MTTHQPAVLPENFIFSERLAISEAAQVSMDAECCRIIQATLDYIRSNYALAALQSQPAAPLRLDQIDLEPLKAELSDPAKAKAFLQKHGFLNASGELAEQYGGNPEQPAAAGVSDGEIAQAVRPLYADDAAAKMGLPDDIKTARAILALRPQAVPMAEDTELLEFMAEHRVSVTPEYEGQWCARRYDDEPQAVDEVEAETPREALRELLACHHGITAQGAQGGEANHG